MTFIRIPFCEQISETLQEQIDCWTLIADFVAGTRIVEHTWSYMDRGWGLPPRTGTETRTVDAFRRQIGDSPLLAKLEAALAAADAAARRETERPQAQASGLGLLA